MKTVTFTEFCKDASALFSAVEKGETIQINKHGKPIAKIVPLNDKVSNPPSCKTRRIRKIVKGEALSTMILRGREPS